MGSKSGNKSKQEAVTKRGFSWIIAKLARFLLRITLGGIAWFILILSVFIYTAEKPDVSFTAYSLPDTMPLEGKLAKNTRLNNAERLYVDLIHGPEAFDIYGNNLYFSAHGGLVYKMNESGIEPVLKIGEKCSGHWEEKKCGRPLGIKFDSKGRLYVVDAFYGIYSANLTTGEMTNIVPMGQKIDGKVSKLPNSIAISKGGVIYWTDSSTSDYLDNGFLTLLADGNGRVMMFDPEKKISSPLLKDLLFPNGIVLSPKEDCLLIAVTGKAQILKYHLTGENAGKSSVFASGLPGFPDNLRLNEKNQLVVSLISPFDTNQENTLGLISSWPNVRKIIYYLVCLIDLIFEKLYEYYPTDTFLQIAHWVGNFESLNFMASKSTRVVLYDLNGNIVDSFHGNDGSVSFVCDFIEYKGSYYLGSPYNNYLGKVTK